MALPFVSFFLLIVVFNYVVSDITLVIEQLPVARLFVVIVNGRGRKLIVQRNHIKVIAVASNKYQEATVKLVKHYFPTINFIEILGQREGINVKPDPSIVFDILQKANVNKEEVLYVGDSGVDMQTAINAGVDAVGVTWGFRPRTELEGFQPMGLIDKAEELLGFI